MEDRPCLKDLREKRNSYFIFGGVFFGIGLAAGAYSHVQSIGVEENAHIQQEIDSLETKLNEFEADFAQSEEQLLTCSDSCDFYLDQYRQSRSDIDVFTEEISSLYDQKLGSGATSYTGAAVEGYLSGISLVVSLISTYAGTRLHKMYTSLKVKK
jgi:hypothetical protein